MVSMLMRGFNAKAMIGDPAKKLPDGKAPFDSFPTQAEEFDAHKYRMQAKHENINETKWHDKVSARNIFRYDTMFPDLNHEFRPVFREHESKVFSKNEMKKRYEFERRRIDVLRLIKLRNSLVTKRKKADEEKSRGPLFGEIVRKTGFDENFNIITNVGQDDFLKLLRHKAEIKKSLNNKKMDELVRKMNYLDYRDFLAINKYIIESKRTNDYHIIARGNVLQTVVEK